MRNTEPLLRVEHLRVEVPTRRGTLVAVDDVSFDIAPGEVLGVVGESGAGKSLTGAAIIGLLEPPLRIAGGRIALGSTRIDNLPYEAMRRIRGKEIGAIFQDPLTSLNPLYAIGHQLVETIRTHLDLGPAEARARALSLLREVGISGADERIDHYPHQFSGGMRQRVVIALALAANPRLIIADEPTTALDVSIQAQMINLFEELQTEFNLTYLFIAHDLAVVRHISDRVAVMYLGVIVEVSPADELYESPLHPYTISLLSAIPIPDPVVERARKPILLAGDLPSPANPPAACRFHTRCPYVQDTRCRDETPPLRELAPGHMVACHWAEQIRAGQLEPKQRLAEAVAPVQAPVAAPPSTA